MPPTDAPEPHRSHAMAESFGEDPARYDRARPRYPDALVAAVVAASPGTEVLDVGTGTGILGQQLRAAGCRVLGVEVDARMAEFARRAGLDVEVAPFEEWEPEGRTFDAVVSGQSWHWVDAAAGAAKAARVLAPGGLLAPAWNTFDPSAEVAEAFAEVYRRAVPEAPFNPWSPESLGGYSRLFARAVEVLREAGGFGAPEERRVEWERPYTRDEWLEQVLTHGDVLRLRPDEREALLSGMAEAIDAWGGRLAMGYETVALFAVRDA